MIAIYVATAKRKYNLDISLKEQKDVLRKVIEHYIEHCLEYTVYVNSTDPFKFIAWIGLFLFNDIKKQSSRRNAYILISVGIMKRKLEYKNKILDISFVRKLYEMTIHDKNSEKDHLAIGMNGLYMSFRSASMVKTKT